MARAEDIPETGAVSPGVAEQVRAALDEGHALPTDLRRALFESKREYELTYAEKQREADILAETMAVPLQPIKTFGSANGGWENKLILGDNLQVLKTLLQMKDRGELTDSEGKPGVSLIYIDPPFATRQEFRGGRDEQAYQDKVIGAQFLEFMRRRLIFMRELLTSDGSIYVHLDMRKVHYIKILLDEIFGEHNFRTEVIWKRSSAHSDTKQGRRQHGRIHDLILFYTRGSKWKWNQLYTAYDQQYIDDFYQHVEPETGRRYYLGDITGPGGAAKGNPKYEVMGVTRYWRFSKATMERLISEGRVVQEKPGTVPRFKRYLDEAEGVPLQDIWTDIPPVPAHGKKRRGYPTQKPEELMDRVIDASSGEGDVVLDAFLGSGTTALSAERLDRRWIGIDCGKLAIYTTQKALLERGADKRSMLTPAPFTLYNAGLYDYGLLRDLPWANFRSFALELFQCRDVPHRVGQVSVDGFLGLDHVLVFNFQRHKDAALDKEFIHDLHKAIGDKIGRRFLIVAPAASVQFLEDYVELEGPNHPVRYFVLRVPYSVIDEIHHRGFTRLRQPASLGSVNDTVDSVGFDFIQPPSVKCTYARTKNELTVKIRTFETEAMTRNGNSPHGFDALAMVMVDLDYDGEVFDLDEVIYADELERAGYKFSLSSPAGGKRVMLIYVDVYGNEHREVKKPSDFRLTKGQR